MLKEVIGSAGTTDLITIHKEAHGLMGNSVVGLCALAPYHKALVLISYLKGGATQLQVNDFPANAS